MNEILTILIFPLIVAVAGWLRNASQDGRFEWFEWKKLIETVLVVTVPVAMLHYGLGADEVLAGSIISLIVLTITEVKNAVSKVKAKPLV